MTQIALPPGWEEINEPHPDDGVAAYTHSRFRHTEGLEVSIWSEVIEGGRDYTVEESDQYAIEVYGEDGEYIEGESFDAEEGAVKTAREAMNRFPD